MADLTNILQDNDELNDEQLKKYLSGKISSEELHTMEKHIADSAFVSDGVEGLQAFQSTNLIDEYAQQLNNNLHQQLNQKKERREKRKIKALLWIIVAVIIIMILCVLTFVIIKMYREKQIEKTSVTVQYLKTMFQFKELYD
jgi:anti-sigma factor RsiW